MYSFLISRTNIRICKSVFSPPLFLFLVLLLVSVCVCECVCVCVCFTIACTFSDNVWMQGQGQKSFLIRDAEIVAKIMNSNDKSIFMILVFMLR